MNLFLLNETNVLYPLYTEPATFVPPPCDHKTDQVAVGRSKEAAWLSWSFKGGTQDVQQSPWSPSSFECVQNSRRRVTEEVGHSTVTQMRQRGCIAVVAEWMHNGRPMITTQYMHATSKLSPLMWATFLPPICLLCASNSVLWMMTVTTTLPPFGDHGDAWASMLMVLPSFCLLYATSCAPASCLWIRGLSREAQRSQEQLHRNKIR